MNEEPTHDPEQHRMRFGCLALLVAIGILLFAFAMGAVTTSVAHREGRLTDPWGAEGPAQIFEMPEPESDARSDSHPGAEVTQDGEEKEDIRVKGERIP